MKSRHPLDLTYQVRKKTNTHCIFTVLLAEAQKSLPSRHRPQVSHPSPQSGTGHQTQQGSADRRLRSGAAPLPETGLFHMLLESAILHTINDTYCSGI